MDVERVCCMCGDIGFPDKIFRCINCHHRYQHSYICLLRHPQPPPYCSSTYSQSSEPPELCDWCRTNEVKTSEHRGSSKKPTAKLDVGISQRSENSSMKMKQHDGREEGSSEKGKPPTGAPSPRTRRYKLLKDVMC